MVSRRDIDLARRKMVDTIPKIIRHNYDRWADEIAMSVRRKKYTWRQYYEVVGHFSLGLISLGLERGDVVCIMGDNAPEWFWGEFAVQAAGGIAAGILINYPPSEVKYIASHSGAKFAIVNGQVQIDKFLAVKTDLPALKKIIYWDSSGLKNYDDPMLISFNDVAKLGKEYAETHPKFIEQNIDNGNGDDIAFIYYTPGMQGLLRGVDVSHRALINTGNNFTARYPLAAKEILNSVLPAAGVDDSFFSIMPHLLTGTVLNFPEKQKNHADDTRKTDPDFARQCERTVSEIQGQITNARGIERFCYNLFLPVGYKIADYKIKNKTPNILWRLLYILSYYLLSCPFKNKLRLTNVRFVVTDGSVLSRDTLRLIYAFGVELIYGYASTEAGLVSSHSKKEIYPESLGRLTLGTEVRILNSGELLVRSESVFSGYHNDPQKTVEVLIDGWYHTGTRASINEKGHLVLIKT